MLKLMFDRDRIYLYPYQFADESLTNDMKEVFGRGIDGPIYSEFREGHRYEYARDGELNALGKYFFEKILAETDFPEKVKRNTFRLGDELLTFCDSVSSLSLKSVSDDKLVDMYDEYAKRIRIMRAWGWIPPLVDGADETFLTDHIQDSFQSLLRAQGREANTNEYFSILSSSEEESEVRNEERIRLDLFMSIVGDDDETLKHLRRLSSEEFLCWVDENREKKAGMVRDHAKEFEWLPYAYEGPGMTAEDVVTLLRETLESGIDPKAVLNDMKTRPERLVRRKAEIIRELDMPDELQHLFRVLTVFMAFKDHRKGLYQRSYVKMDPVLEEIGRRSGLKLQEVKYLTQKEIGEALSGRDFKSICSERVKYCMARTENGVTKFLSPEEIENIKREIRDETAVSEENDLRGQIAYPGVARGKAKIVLVREDVEKMNEGDIIVSSSTNPDLISAMQKASAFVTDMGGITCHAAIVAREMRKPCIVGTKIATKVFHDGDEIEVNADDGVIRKVRKSD